MEGIGGQFGPTVRKGNAVKLNIGAGNKRIPGYTGVDAVARSAADIVAPAWDIPLEDGSVDEILACHIWEHFYRFDCEKVITEWHRLLKPGALLAMEMPNLIKACENIIAGREGKHPDQLTMWALYGDPREGDEWMAHRWSWHPASLQDFLSQHGFDSFQEKPTQFHRTGRFSRDFRLEARKSRA